MTHGVSLDTDAGRVTVLSDTPGTTRGTPAFAAAWDHALDEPTGDGLPGLRAARPGAFVAANHEGLVVERGPYGGRPLYYAVDAAGVRVSTRLAPLVEGLSPYDLDVNRLGALGVTRIGPDPRATSYRGVYRVLPCEVITFGEGGSLRRAFRLPSVPAARTGSVNEHARAVRETIEAVLARDLAPYEAAAVQTGGGVDSSGLYAFVLRHAARTGSLRCTALAMDFAGPGDDRPHLRALLAHVGGSAIRVAPSEVSRIPRRFFVQDGWPYLWPTCPVGAVLHSRASEWGADVMVTGFGGDFILDGDLTTFRDRTLRGDLGAVADAARLRVPWPSSPGERVARFVAKPVLRACFPASYFARRNARAVAASEVGRWAGRALRPLLEEPLTESAHDDWLTAFARSYAMMEGADGVGQTEAAFGMPYVTPYLDPRLIELVASFPREQLFAGDRLRGLYRIALEGLVPDSVRFRENKASFEPMLDEMFAAAGGGASFEPLLKMEATGDLGLVEPARFRETFAKVAGRTPTARGWLEVWPMLAVEAFVQETRERGTSGRAAALGEA